MDLHEIQRIMKEFTEERHWNEFSPALVFTHLIEEIGEIGRAILFETGYKKADLGHPHTPENMNREFAQSFNLFLQLANHYGVDLEDAWKNEYAIMRKRFPVDEWVDYMEKKKKEDNSSSFL